MAEGDGTGKAPATPRLLPARPRRETPQPRRRCPGAPGTGDRRRARRRPPARLRTPGATHRACKPESRQRSSSSFGAMPPRKGARGRRPQAERGSLRGAGLRSAASPGPRCLRRRRASAAGQVRTRAAAAPPTAGGSARASAGPTRDAGPARAPAPGLRSGLAGAGGSRPGYPRPRAAHRARSESRAARRCRAVGSTPAARPPRPGVGRGGGSSSGGQRLRGGLGGEEFPQLHGRQCARPREVSMDPEREAGKGAGRLWVPARSLREGPRIGTPWSRKTPWFRSPERMRSFRHSTPHCGSLRSQTSENVPT